MEDTNADAAAIAEFMRQNGISTESAPILKEKKLMEESEETAEAFLEEETPQEAPEKAQEPSEDEDGAFIPKHVREQLREAAEEDSNASNEDDRDEYVELPENKEFAKNKRPDFDNMFVPVGDMNVPITQEDKDVYFKSMLFDTPIELPVFSMGGNVKVVCRALTVYENDLVYAALERAMKDRKVVPSVWEGICQQYRMAMQIISINNVDFGCLRFNTPGNIDEDAEALIKKADFVYKLNTAKYNLLLRSLNVFQHKITRLNSATYNQDFWDPDGID